MEPLLNPSKVTTRAYRNSVAIGSLLFFPVGIFVTTFLGLSWPERVLVSLPLTVVFTVALGKFLGAAHRFNTASVSADAFFTHRNTVKVVSLSELESMIATANASAAAEKFEELLAIHGLDDRLCRTAVDFHLGKLGSSETGEALLKRMRIENPAQFEHYVTQRLIDLYMKREETYPRARTELRRLAAQNPGTSEAAGALAAIERLKTVSL